MQRTGVGKKRHHRRKTMQAKVASQRIFTRRQVPAAGLLVGGAFGLLRRALLLARPQQWRR